MKNIKQEIKKIPVLGNLSVKLYKKISPQRYLTFWLRTYLPIEYASIVQIGSNDGKTSDPIFHIINERKTWHALLVEPVPYLFERLKTNYGSNPRYIFKNVAINSGVAQVFYSVKQEAKNKFPELPHWFDQLGSFNKKNITKHLNGKLKPFIAETYLQGITLTDLLSENSIEFIDLLHIDTEGYDWIILSQLKLSRYKPNLILFEHIHLTKLEKQQSIDFLSDLYYIIQFGRDFLAVRKNITKRNHLIKVKSKLIS